MQGAAARWGSRAPEAPVALDAASPPACQEPGSGGALLCWEGAWWVKRSTHP